jgi:hypothetical protein
MFHGPMEPNDVNSNATREVRIGVEIFLTLAHTPKRQRQTGGRLVDIHHDRMCRGFCQLYQAGLSEQCYPYKTSFGSAYF